VILPLITTDLTCDRQKNEMYDVFSEQEQDHYITMGEIGQIRKDIKCYALCYIFVPRVDLSQLLTLSVRPDRLTAVYRTHFGCCRYLDT
jgi:hypothetical protein